MSCFVAKCQMFLSNNILATRVSCIVIINCSEYSGSGASWSFWTMREAGKGAAGSGSCCTVLTLFAQIVWYSALLAQILAVCNMNRVLHTVSTDTCSPNLMAQFTPECLYYTVQCGECAPMCAPVQRRLLHSIQSKPIQVSAQHCQAAEMQHCTEVQFVYSFGPAM